MSLPKNQNMPDKTNQPSPTQDEDQTSSFAEIKAVPEHCQHKYARVIEQKDRQIDEKNKLIHRLKKKCEKMNRYEEEVVRLGTKVNHLEDTIEFLEKNHEDKNRGYSSLNSSKVKEDMIQPVLITGRKKSNLSFTKSVDLPSDSVSQEYSLLNNWAKTSGQGWRTKTKYQNNKESNRKKVKFSRQATENYSSNYHEDHDYDESLYNRRIKNERKKLQPRVQTQIQRSKRKIYHEKEMKKINERLEAILRHSLDQDDSNSRKHSFVDDQVWSNHSTRGKNSRGFWHDKMDNFLKENRHPYQRVPRAKDPNKQPLSSYFYLNSSLIPNYSKCYDHINQELTTERNKYKSSRSFYY